MYITGELVRAAVSRCAAAAGAHMPTMQRPIWVKTRHLVLYCNNKLYFITIYDIGEKCVTHMPTVQRPMWVKTRHTLLYCIIYYISSKFMPLGINL